MNKLYYWGVLLSFTFFQIQVKAQDTSNPSELPVSPKEFANPSVEGMGKSKGVVINYERQSTFGIRSTSPDPSIGNREGDVRRNNKFNVKFYVPALNNPHLKIIAGFDYSFEEFNFNYPQPPAYKFYNNIEDKNLKSLGGQVVVLRPINERNYFIFRVKGELNGDYESHQVAVPDYLKTTVEFLYGWKKSPMLSYGVGAQLGYVLGRRRIYPAFLYNRTFNAKWGLESILPARFDIRYNASEKSLWFAGLSVDGANYNINVVDPKFTNLETMELRRSEVRGRVRWEREIYDFLWVGAEAGYRVNFSFDVFDKESNNGFLFSKRGEPLIDNRLKGSPLFKVEVFLVPPRRFLKQ